MKFNAENQLYLIAFTIYHIANDIYGCNVINHINNISLNDGTLNRHLFREFYPFL